MELEHLKAFLQVVESGSVSAAAERLDLSQPALSRRLVALESSLGTRLFRRTGRGVVPTDDGARIEQHARRVLDEVGRLRSGLAGDLPPTGRVRLGLPPSLGVTVSAILVERCRRQYPGIALHLVEDLSGAVQDGLLRGELDVGILYGGVLSSTLAATPLSSESLSLIVPHGALPAGEPVPFAALAQYPLVLPGIRHGLRALLQQYAFRYGLLLRVEVEVDSLRALCDVVRRGLGFTVLPATALATSDGLEILPIIRPTLNRSLVVARRRGEAGAPAAAAVVDLVRDITSERTPAIEE